MGQALEQGPAADALGLRFKDTYAQAIPELVSPQKSVPVAGPQLVEFNFDLADALGVTAPIDTDHELSELAALLSGNVVPTGAHPVAQAYAGHQFGGYSPVLGDGRAVVLGEVLTPSGSRFDIALKGSGRTRFSRGGDGRAALGPVLREYLMGEAMHALGIPTTRALAAVTTGERVLRQTPQVGAVLTRVAASHLRVGTFQYAASTGDRDVMARLMAYAIERHGVEGLDTSEVLAADTGEQARALLTTVVARQARLVASWMHVGFIHGVMNTDNMTISGETIDYGPCAFMEAYNPDTVFSSIDHGGRYRYAHQPSIALWNLARLAESLLAMLLDHPWNSAGVAEQDRAVAEVTDILDGFEPAYRQAWLDGARRKLAAPLAKPELAEDFLELLRQREVDFTLGWRSLVSAIDLGDQVVVELLGHDAAVKSWLQAWRQVCDPTRRDEMASASPFYIPRNHLVEEALDAATTGDSSPFRQLLDVVRSPFSESDGLSSYAQPADPSFTARHVTYCGT